MIYAEYVIYNLAAHYCKHSTVFNRAADFLCSSQNADDLKSRSADKMTDESNHRMWTNSCLCFTSMYFPFLTSSLARWDCTQFPPPFPAQGQQRNDIWNHSNRKRCTFSARSGFKLLNTKGFCRRFLATFVSDVCRWSRFTQMRKSKSTAEVFPLHGV